MSASLFVSILSLIQKSVIDFSKESKEKRKERAAMLRHLADAADLLLAGAAKLQECVLNREPPREDAMRDICIACTMIDEYCRETRLSTPVTREIARIAHWIQISPLSLKNLADHIHPNGTINWVSGKTEGHPLQVKIRSISVSMRSILTSKRELTSLAAKLRAKANLVETGMHQ